MSGVAFVRKLTQTNIDEYFQSLTDRKGEYEFSGRSGWTYIYDNPELFPPELVKLARRYKLFACLVSNAKKKKGTAKSDADKADEAYEALTAKGKAAFHRRQNLKSTLKK